MFGWENVTIRVLANNMMPYISNASPPGGFLGEAWTTLQHVLKFNSEITNINNYSEGIRLMKEGRYDIYLAAVVHTPNLLTNQVAMSHPYFTNWYHLYFKKTKYQAGTLRFLSALDQRSWVLFTILMSLLSVILWRATAVLDRLHGRGRRNVSLFRCFLNVYSGFLNQGFDMEMNHGSLKILIMTAIIFGQLIFHAVSVVNIAKLAIHDVKQPVTTLQDLIEKRTHSLCVRTNSFVYNYFRDANHNILPAWRGILNGPGCTDIIQQANVAKIICDKRVIILENRIVMEAIKKQEHLDCQIAYIKKRMFAKSNFVLLNRHFSHLKALHRSFHQLKSSGVLRQMQRKWIKHDHNSKNTPPFSAITIWQARQVFILYAINIAVAFVVLVGELAWRRFEVE